MEFYRFWNQKCQFFLNKVLMVLLGESFEIILHGNIKWNFQIPFDQVWNGYLFKGPLFVYNGGASHTKTKYPVIIKTTPLVYYFVIRGQGRLVLGEQDSCYICQ